jgi:hypothetical protein
MVDRIALASLAGLRPVAIATLVNRDQQYVGVVLHKLRKRGVLPATELCSNEEILTHATPSHSGEASLSGPLSPIGAATPRPVVTGRPGLSL